MLERSEKIGVYIIGSVWPIIGVIFYIIVLPDSYQGKLLLNILLYSVIFIFPAWILVHLVLQFAEREPVQKPIREAIESLRLELQSAEQELELERSTAENEEQERRAAWEAEEQAAAAARLAERIAVHNARQSPRPRLPHRPCLKQSAAQAAVLVSCCVQCKARNATIAGGCSCIVDRI